MAIIQFSCPTCQRPLKVGQEYAGRQSKCPGCGSFLTVPAAPGGSGAIPDWMSDAPAAPAPAPRPPVVPPRTPAVSPRPRAPAVPPPSYGVAEAPEENFDGIDEGDLPDDWKSVRGGLGLLRTSTIVNICAFLVAFVGFGILFAVFGTMVFTALSSTANSANTVNTINPGRPPRPAVTPQPAVGAVEQMGILFVGLGIGVVGLVGVLWFAGIVLKVVGALKVLPVPEASKAKPWAIGFVVCVAIVVGCTILSFLASAAGAGNLGNTISAGSSLASLAEVFFFLFFLHQLGTYLGSPELRKYVVNYAIWLGVTWGVWIMSICATFGLFFAAIFTAAASRSPSNTAAGTGIITLGIMGFIAIVCITLGIIVLVKYLQLLSLAQRVIARRAGQLGTTV
jgi:hypothetical protein